MIKIQAQKKKKKEKKAYLEIQVIDQIKMMKVIMKVDIKNIIIIIN